VANIFILKEPLANPKPFK